MNPLSYKGELMPRTGLRLFWGVAILWLATGLAMISLDELIQPQLTALGTNPIIHAFALAWQNLGATVGITCFLVAGLATVLQDRGRTFVMFILCAASAGIAVQIVKNLVGRARPNFVHDQSFFYGPLGMFYHGPRIQLDSMPSGHTTAAFAMAFALSSRWRKLAWLWFFLAVGVGVSRTLVDCHFPSDVVVASCFGTLIGWGICSLVSRYPLKREALCAY